MCLSAPERRSRAVSFFGLCLQLVMASAGESSGARPSAASFGETFAAMAFAGLFTLRRPSSPVMATAGESSGAMPFAADFAASLLFRRCLRGSSTGGCVAGTVTGACCAGSFTATCASKANRFLLVLGTRSMIGVSSSISLELSDLSTVSTAQGVAGT